MSMRRVWREMPGGGGYWLIPAVELSGDALRRWNTQAEESAIIQQAEAKARAGDRRFHGDALLPFLLGGPR